MADIHGMCDERFEAVRDALAKNLDSGEELGASIVVDIDGDIVVDMWGGFRDEARTIPWDEHTITNVWSSTKTVTSLAALMLVDRGELDVDAAGREVLARVRRQRQAGRPGPAPPVARLRGLRAGPAGRGRGPLRLGAGHLPDGGPGAVVGAGHRVGLPRAQLRAPGRRGRAADQRQAAQAVRGRGDRRAAGRGLPDRRGGKRLGPDRRRGPAAAAADSTWRRSAWTARRSRRSPGPSRPPSDANTPGWRRADIGAANGHGNARSVARVMSVVARGGEVDGVRLLSPDTIDLIFREQLNGIDLVLGVPLRFGIGYGLPRPTSCPTSRTRRSASGAAGAVP